MNRNLEHDACALISKRFKYSVEDLRSKALDDNTIIVQETTNGTTWQVKAKGEKLVVSEIE